MSCQNLEVLNFLPMQMILPVISCAIAVTPWKVSNGRMLRFVDLPLFRDTLALLGS